MLPALIFELVRENRAGVLHSSLVNMRIEHMSMIKDWFLLSPISIFLSSPLSSVLSFALFVIIDSKSNEDKSECLGQSFNQFLLVFLRLSLSSTLKIRSGEVCVNTCHRKYCVSQIDKLSSEVLFVCLVLLSIH